MKFLDSMMTSLHNEVAKNWTNFNDYFEVNLIFIIIFKINFFSFLKK